MKTNVDHYLDGFEHGMNPVEPEDDTEFEGVEPPTDAELAEAESEFMDLLDALNARDYFLGLCGSFSKGVRDGKKIRGVKYD